MSAFRVAADWTETLLTHQHELTETKEAHRNDMDRLKEAHQREVNDYERQIAGLEKQTYKMELEQKLGSDEGWAGKIFEALEKHVPNVLPLLLQAGAAVTPRAITPAFTRQGDERRRG